VRILPDFSQSKDKNKNVISLTDLNSHPEKLRFVRLLRTVLRGGCTKTGHRVVDGAHSIENRRVAGGDFSLTKKLEGVEQ
jgi:hypothetical protein